MAHVTRFDRTNTRQPTQAQLAKLADDRVAALLQAHEDFQVESLVGWRRQDADATYTAEAITKAPVANAHKHLRERAIPAYVRDNGRLLADTTRVTRGEITRTVDSRGRVTFSQKVESTNLADARKPRKPRTPKTVARESTRMVAESTKFGLAPITEGSY